MSSETPTSSDRGQSRLLERLEEMEREVAGLRRELDQSQRLATLGTIAGSIAHEFNNILTPVLSYAQMALATQGDQALVAKALHKAMDGSERASKIASAMLGFVKDEERGPADVSGVVDQTLACLARDPSRDGVKLKLEIEPSLSVAMSSVALQQVLMNLILNAVEAMKPSGGDLTIRAWRGGDHHEDECSTWNTSDGAAPLPLSDSRVSIEISDTGRGAPAEIAARLFEPFVTAPHDSEGRRGHGLGLPICKRLVEAAGGTIRMKTAPGEGATIRIDVPGTPAEETGIRQALSEHATK